MTSKSRRYYVRKQSGHIVGYTDDLQVAKDRVNALATASPGHTFFVDDTKNPERRALQWSTTSVYSRTATLPPDIWQAP